MEGAGARLRSALASGCHSDIHSDLCFTHHIGHGGSTVHTPFVDPSQSYLLIGVLVSFSCRKTVPIFLCVIQLGFGGK